MIYFTNYLRSMSNRLCSGLPIPENMTHRIPEIMAGRTKRLNYDGRTPEKHLHTYPDGGGAHETHAGTAQGPGLARGGPYPKAGGEIFRNGIKDRSENMPYT